MAEQTSNIKVNVDLKQAIADFELLDKNVEDTKDSIISLEAQILKLEKERAALDPKALNRLRDYNEAIDKTKQRLKEEKGDLKQLNAERSKAKKNVDELTKKNKDLEGATSMLDRATGGLISGFKGMKSAVGGAIKSLGKMKVALLASGIGLIVVTLGALVAAFKRSEEGQNKFAKLMGVIGAVTNQLMDGLATFGEAIINAVTKPKEAWNSFVEAMIQGYGFIKAQVLDRLIGTFMIAQGKVEKAILNMRIAWKKFWGNDKAVKSLTEQLNKVEEKIQEGAKKIAGANNEIADSYNNAKNSIKGVIDETIREGQIAADIADQRAKADKIERKLIVERAEATRKVNELREKAARREDFSSEQRIEFLKEAGRVEEEIVNKQIDAARIRLEQKQRENALGKTTKEDLDEVANLEAKLINLEGKRLRKQKAISAEITTNIREEKREKEQAIKEFTDKYVYLPGMGFVSRESWEKMKADGKAVEDKLKEFEIRREDEAAETELQKLQLEEQRTMAELDRLNATEDQKLAVKKFYSDKYLEIDAKNKKQEENLDKQVAAAKLATAGQVFALVGQIAKKGSKVGKIAAIGQTVISGIQAVQNAYSTAQLSPITAINPGYPLQQAIIAGAFSAAQLAKLIATNPESPAVAGGLRPTEGGGNQPAVPQFNIVGQGGSSQLATALADQEQPPVQAYVVSQDVTTAQSLENNIISGATLGG
jgi:DNA repair exonuclease SbcCD ATPase subunit